VIQRHCAAAPRPTTHHTCPPHNLHRLLPVPFAESPASPRPPSIVKSSGIKGIWHELAVEHGPFRTRAPALTIAAPAHAHTAAAATHAAVALARLRRLVAAAVAHAAGVVAVAHADATATIALAVGPALADTAAADALADAAAAALADTAAAVAFAAAVASGTLATATHATGALAAASLAHAAAAALADPRRPKIGLAPVRRARCVVVTSCGVESGDSQYVAGARDVVVVCHVFSVYRHIRLRPTPPDDQTRHTSRDKRADRS